MPFAGYEDHEECVADNQDKDDPDAYCAELEREEQAEAATEMPARRVSVSVPDSYRTQALQDDTVQPPDQPVTQAPEAWEGVLVVEGTPTGDGRLMEPGSLRWEDLPLPLRHAPSDEGEHAGAVVIGQVTEVWRDGNLIRGRGTFDLGSEQGREAARLVAEGMVTGVSVDMDDVDMEIRVAQEVLDEMDAELEAMLDGEDPDQGERETDEDGRVTVAEFNSDDELLVTTDARIRAATLLDIPAFAEAQVQAAEGAQASAAQVVTAAAADDDAPPRAWFEDPALAEPTPLTVTDEGRVYGHLACWGACHTAFSDECVTPPSSPSAYRYFRTGAVRTAEGDEVAVGRITADTLHAGRRASPVDTLAHYENTGMALADVAAGEDVHGIWIAGSLRPGVTEEQLRTLRGSPLSGDWRRIGGELELVAALAVNSPGFPVPRAMVAGGAVAALQSAGTVSPDAPQAELTADDRRLLAQLARRERRAQPKRRRDAERARRRLQVASAASRVKGVR